MTILDTKAVDEKGFWYDIEMQLAGQGFYQMTSCCNIPPSKGEDNSDTSLDNSLNLVGVKRTPTK
ncbi:MAG: hypothetical protein K0R54_4479 [Clostridiaceae bacterium]|jgi:hypothetical protein|nr:hypothetical protein [Clostridiaceae bacterium]